ncbi:hypothetical protein [Corynebacterium cystitidis]|uniref:Uncharacterized protein n=1 Tax=Corynebacterium cystitidis DSM 20524 TaxID=1121357 RepID=A0A1H9NVD2_9CORY|nr:hypothetical protein [Corynebacterium cystitidis]WJY82715.1 hypothetical protein CCYS_09005 [Corynebacterium cystitidis DSM 20524]SER39910.1 hypothetical protein SAMN05661109_00116 [Corynebacterium cystitidis DSM 20524]SNV71449.1 Uncharacterised protein [Corynebacterium cystitidis]
MPSIQFDILIPDQPTSAAEELADAFRRAVQILEKHKMLTDGEVAHTPGQKCDDFTVNQLRNVYREERGEDPDHASMHRIIVTADNVRSYNQLAMGLSRILTPPAKLPNDPVALERETDFELPSLYPWTVEILR